MATNDFVMDKVLYSVSERTQARRIRAGQRRYWTI